MGSHGSAGTAAGRGAGQHVADIFSDRERNVFLIVRRLESFVAKQILKIIRGDNMGNGHSLACGKHHIYDKIDEKCDSRQNGTPAGAMMGNRKESLVTLDIKIEDLDKEETNKENLDWGESAETGADTEWLQENGWTNGQFRRREDILYNIFMIETVKTRPRILIGPASKARGSLTTAAWPLLT